MAWLIEQILALLATEAGSLTYHLILAFSIAGALQFALTQRTRRNSAPIQRAVLGLSLLLSFQIILFVSSGLVWQGVIDGQLWLPLLDRSVTLISIVILIWLWGFPDINPSADAATLVVSFLALIGCLFGAFWWMRVSVDLGIAELPVNGSAIDLNFQLASFLLLGIGFVVLIFTRPPGWGYGLSMLLLLALGHGFHWLLLPYTGDYPFVLRFFQMGAFPFLLILPQRNLIGQELKENLEAKPIPISDEQPEKILETDQGGGESRNKDFQLIQLLLTLTEEGEESQLCRRIVNILAQFSRAELVYLFAPPDTSGNISILCGYDHVTRRYVETATVDGRSFPILVSCLKNGRLRRMPASSVSPDGQSLVRLYGLENINSMLFIPILNSGMKPLAGIIMISTEPNKDWNAEDQSELGLISKFLVNYFHRSGEISELRRELDKAQQAARRVQDQAQLIFEEDRKLQDQLAVLKERSTYDREQLSQVSGILAEHAQFQQKITQLSEENRQLRSSLEQAQLEAERRSEPLIGELRMALEEISLLRSVIENSEDRVTSMELPSDKEILSNPQIENIISISEELRQPLSSIIGYTDLLLGESTGILGSNQRKYLDRIKLSTKRFGRLLDELISISMVESDPTKIEHQEIDVRKVINEALKETDGLFQLRRLVLRSRLPDTPLIIHSDWDALRKVLVQFLRNAATANPEGGEVGITARLESSESDRDFVLIQISDRGEGIALDDLPQVFSPRPDGKKLEGLGNSGVDFFRLKTLVEILGGRTWVDSERGNGSVFSILLPATPDLVGFSSAEG